LKVRVGVRRKEQGFGSKPGPLTENNRANEKLTTHVKKGEFQQRVKRENKGGGVPGKDRISGYDSEKIKRSGGPSRMHDSPWRLGKKGIATGARGASGRGPDDCNRGACTMGCGVALAQRKTPGLEGRSRLRTRSRKVTG